MSSGGGFALITGDTGTGKSVALRILAQRLTRLRDVTVGVLTRPQSKITDFYRELGETFAVQLSPHNRWGGFRVLRERWKAHLESSLLRPVLLVDEATELDEKLYFEVYAPPSARRETKAAAAGGRR